MSGIGEAVVALKNVMLLHERVEDLQKELERLASKQDQMSASITDIDKRLVRTETLVEVAMARREPPRLEG